MEALGGNVGDGQLLEMLFAQTFVGRDEQDVVQRRFAVALVVVQELPIVEVHEQRLAAAGGHPEGQLAQVVRGERRLGCPFRVVLPTQPAVELAQQRLRAADAPVQIVLRVDRRQVLEIAQRDRLGAPGVHGRQVPADVVVVAEQVGALDLGIRARRQADAQRAAPAEGEAFAGDFGLREQLLVRGEPEAVVQPREQHQALLQLRVGGRGRGSVSADESGHGGYSNGANRRWWNSGSKGFAPRMVPAPLKYTSSAPSARLFSATNLRSRV